MKEFINTRILQFFKKSVNSCTLLHYTLPYKQLWLVSSFNHELSDPFTFTLLESKLFLCPLQKPRVWPLKQESNKQKMDLDHSRGPSDSEKKQYRGTFKHFLQVHLVIILVYLAGLHWHQITKQQCSRTRLCFHALCLQHKLFLLGF